MTSSQPGQPGHPSANRALPDAIDLRLLAALTGAGGTVGLPQAAWSAGMPQSEAAARLVQLAESGFPLRLVVEGDARLLHQVIGRGPVVPPTPLTAGAGPGSPSAVAPAGASGGVSGAAGGTDAGATWGLPGSAAWAHREPTRAGQSPSAAGPAPAQADPDGGPTSPGQGSVPPAAAGPGAAGAGTPPRPGDPQSTVGLAGERLSVTVSQIIDPASDVLATAGYVLDPGERAVMVQSAVANLGPASHDCMPDLYLVLVAASGAVLQKAPVSVAGYPAHRVGVAPGGVSDGWTVFLIGADVSVRAARWSVRPDLIDRTLSWYAG